MIYITYHHNSKVKHTDSCKILIIDPFGVICYPLQNYKLVFLYCRFVVQNFPRGIRRRRRWRWPHAFPASIRQLQEGARRREGQSILDWFRYHKRSDDELLRYLGRGCWRQNRYLRSLLKYIFCASYFLHSHISAQMWIHIYFGTKIYTFITILQECWVMSDCIVLYWGMNSFFSFHSMF